MASIHERTRTDGTTTHQVKWREAGRRRSVTAPTKAAAVRIKRLVDAHGTYLPSMAPADAPTLTEWAVHHLEHSTRANADTIEGYRRVLARHVLPVLGELSLPAITPDVVRTWVKGLRMADKTRQQTVSLLSSVLSTAVQAGHLPANPVRGIRLPRTDPPKDPHLITPTDLGVILSEIPDEYRPLVATLAGTGMRWGEATALAVADVDLRADPPTIRVTKAVKHRAAQDDAPGLPKTPRAVRRVALPPQLVPVLAPLCRRLGAEPLFTNTVGKRVRHSTFHGSVWRHALDRAQDPARHGDLALTYRPRIHDLRAFATTWMIDAGVPIDVVADQLGHESVTTTFNIYRRVNPESGRRAAAAMGAVLDRVQALSPAVEPLPLP